jgi:signal transduction histidine kinase
LKQEAFWMKKRRKNVLTNKGLQFRIARHFLLLIILFSLFVGFEVFVSIWQVVSDTIPDNSAALVRNKILFRMVVFAIPVACVIVACSIVLTHHIAGPLYRLEKKLQKLAKGEDVDYIQIRKNDELKGLTSTINDLIRSLKSKNTSQD